MGLRPRVLITTVPFGEVSRRPLELLEEAGVEYVINPIGRRLTAAELASLAPDFDVLIAGTEPITAGVMASAPRLRLISRVGVGLDSVDLIAAREHGILVTYTLEAPGPAVAELTIGLMLSLVRSIHLANAGTHAGAWHRIMGRRLGELTVGIIGVGRIGSRVVQLLEPFGSRILANDLVRTLTSPFVEWTGLDRIYEAADIISVHVPLTTTTRGLIGARELARMKRSVMLVNTARGGILDEADLARALREERIAGAAIDVFCQEPYAGELAGLERCLITCHMGSMSEDCRLRMEVEATENAVEFLAGVTPKQVVPDTEYLLQAEARGSADR